MFLFWLGVERALAFIESTTVRKAAVASGERGLVWTTCGTDGAESGELPY
jgi:hypothetical protein